MRSLGDDRRGVSEIVDYLLGVVIVGVFVSGIVVSATTYFESRDEAAVGATLETEGQELSRSIQTVDRLVRASNSSGEIGRRATLADAVGTHQYRVTVVNSTQAADGRLGCDRACLVFSAGEVTRRIYFRSVTTVQAGTVTGGDVYVVRGPNSSAITLREAS